MMLINKLINWDKLKNIETNQLLVIKKKKPIGFDHIFENYNMEGKYAELFYSDEDSKYIVEFGDAGK